MEGSLLKTLDLHWDPLQFALLFKKPRLRANSFLLSNHYTTTLIHQLYNTRDVAERSSTTMQYTCVNWQLSAYTQRF